jgi:hypothetical protein
METVTDEAKYEGGQRKEAPCMSSCESTSIPQPYIVSQIFNRLRKEDIQIGT